MALGTAQQGRKMEPVNRPQIWKMSKLLEMIGHPMGRVIPAYIELQAIKQQLQKLKKKGKLKKSSGKNKPCRPQHCNDYPDSHF